MSCTNTLTILKTPKSHFVFLSGYHEINYAKKINNLSINVIFHNICHKHCRSPLMLIVFLFFVLKFLIFVATQSLFDRYREKYYIIFESPLLLAKPGIVNDLLGQ